MRTSVPGIYAAGDCCEGNNLESGQKQGETAGINMAGGDAVYKGNILHNITHFMNMDFIGFGDNRMQGEILEYGSLSEDLYIRLVLDGKRIVGANILDNYRVSGIVKNYMLRLFVDTRRGNSASFKNVLQGFFWHLLVIKVPAGTAFFCKF